MKRQTAAMPKERYEPDYRLMANAIRFLSIDAVEKANSGHPGMPLGMADVAAVLFGKYLKFDPRNPGWPDRDRFVLSAGHGSMLLYAALHLCGYEKMTIDEIKRFRQLHSKTPGHPEVDISCGIETTTGPLGQGLANAVGMALSERILNNRFGDDVVDHHTYAIASDGDLMEGISHEACALAGHLKLSRLIVLYDDNGISIDGPTSLSYSDDVRKRFESYGWTVQEIDGHDTVKIDAALAKARAADRPAIICCRTKIGYGAPTKQGKASSHGSPLGPQEIAGVRESLGWTSPPFEIPSEIREMWERSTDRGKAEYAEWEDRLNANLARDNFIRLMNPDVSTRIDPVIARLKREFSSEKPKQATRQLSGRVLENLVPVLTRMVGGSADLTGSNNTKIEGPEVVTPEGNYNGQYIHYGVREHGMAAIMNGMALHGGIIPYSGTFLSFSDYCRPAIRLAALMKQRVIHVMTHDSIGLGEDGPTHQPVEHLAALRAIPNLFVLRPCDGIETAECWQIALNRPDGPSVLALTRQGLTPFRTDTPDNLCARGAYVLSGCDGEPQATLFASGSEVEIAMAAKEILSGKGIATRVVSVPCMDLFFRQDGKYQESVLCNKSVKVAVEAAVRQSWDRLIGPHGVFIGMDGFGESAPYKELYTHFGITPQAVAAAAAERVKKES